MLEIYATPTPPQFQRHLSVNEQSRIGLKCVSCSPAELWYLRRRDKEHAAGRVDNKRHSKRACARRLALYTVTNNPSPRKAAGELSSVDCNDSILWNRINRPRCCQSVICSDEVQSEAMFRRVYGHDDRSHMSKRTIVGHQEFLLRNS
jgi:hypothetical protein